MSTITPQQTTVLVTGATGRIGRVLVADLQSRGFPVRATTSKPQEERVGLNDTIDWRHFDFHGECDYDALLQGCSAVIHLAAELGNTDRMTHTNVAATQLLAEAAERNGVKSFCYASTIAVYGSGRHRSMTEDSPVLTADRDIPSEYWALPYVRMYGRTKLLGEQKIRAAARRVHYTIFRPAVVVSVAQLISIRDWGLSKRVLAAHRHAHHVDVRDVSDAMIWSMVRSMREPRRAGSVDLFNLSEDEFDAPTYADFMKRAFAATGDRRFRVPAVPGFGDWLHDLIRFRADPRRRPLWSMRFPNHRLLAAGYRLSFGMAAAYTEALDSMRKEAELRGSKAAEPTGPQSTHRTHPGLPRSL